MNSIFSRTTVPSVRFSSYGITNLTSSTRLNRSVLKLKTTINDEFPLTMFGARCYSSIKTASKRKSKIRKSDFKPPAAVMDEEKNGFFVVRKGDVVGVYKNFIDCQAQVGSSVCDPPVSVYKGYNMPKETETYLLSRGLKDALYSIRAADLKEDLFGSLVPCPFQNPHIFVGELDRTFQQVLGSQTGRACILEFDGACKGNPGQSGAGAVLRTPDGSLFCRLREGLGIATNNVAEYRAMILGLRYARSKGFTSIHVFGDSKLVCMQIQGLWRARHKNIIQWYEKAKKLKDEFTYFQIDHVLRDKNSEADAQANLAAVLAVGEVEEEEVDTGKFESQSQQSVSLSN